MKIRLFILSYIFCILWASLCALSFDLLGYPYDISDSNSETLSHMIFYTWVFAPIWEEFAFRYGPIEFAKSIGEKAIKPAIIMSSCFFGWIHYSNPESVLLQGVLGLVFSNIYLKNGLLWSIALHSLYNISVTFF